MHPAGSTLFWFWAWLCSTPKNEVQSIRHELVGLRLSVICPLFKKSHGISRLTSEKKYLGEAGTIEAQITLRFLIPGFLPPLHWPPGSPRISPVWMQTPPIHAVTSRWITMVKFYQRVIFKREWRKSYPRTWALWPGSSVVCVFVWPNSVMLSK